MAQPKLEGGISMHTNDTLHCLDEISTTDDTLQCFAKVMPFLNALYNSDVAVTLADTEKVILYKAGEKIELQGKIGVPLKEGTAVYRALSTLTTMT
jgi:hypothetical protein